LNKWISVQTNKGRLPEPKELVIVTDGKAVTVAAYVETIIEYWNQVNETTQKLKSETSTYWAFESEDWFDVTHWMPLPEPPNEL
jgi:hypothetical protein